MKVVLSAMFITSLYAIIILPNNDFADTLYQIYLVLIWTRMKMLCFHVPHSRRN